ncbi:MULTISPECIES: FkbM family methyltransferase [Falsihalocynthiibacter]|uniref:FkbM family methyltransferase n=1 Tax=Falsihalocynthiibacter TaxID=2854182 RepID=UPI0030029076
MNFRALATKRNPHSVVDRLLAATRLAGSVSREDSKLVLEFVYFTHGQLLQDLFAILASKGKHGGTFVEVGVGSGRRISNTFVLEKELGWTGILVEPNISSHASIRALRSSFLETRAAASKSGLKLQFEEVMDDGEFSRLSGANGHTVDASRIKRYDVETITLNDIFAASDMPDRIDFLSLDTEGSEVDILAGLDLDRYTFGAMAIEHNHNPTALADLRRILLPKGYKQVLEHLSGFDAWFVHSSSPNQFDGD